MGMGKIQACKLINARQDQYKMSENLVGSRVRNCTVKGAVRTDQRPHQFCRN